MRKIDNFLRALAVLRSADASRACDDIYRMGMIGQFSFTVELAWKALQAVLRLHSVLGAESGSPREIFKLACSVGFLDDDPVWLDMISARNSATHIYDEDAARAIVAKIAPIYVPAFDRLARVLDEKVKI